MPIINRSPDESACVTQPHGIITCIRQINKECVRQLNEEVDEHDIQQVLIKGGDYLPKEYKKIIFLEIRGYTEKIVNSIRELGYNMNLTLIIFVGGGVGVMKRFGNLHQNNISYIEDVKAMRKDSISYRMLHWHFIKEQKTELQRAMAVRIPKEVILSYFYPETSVTRMMEIQKRYE